jgi:uncharacterized membrane protein
MKKVTLFVSCFFALCGGFTSSYAADATPVAGCSLSLEEQAFAGQMTDANRAAFCQMTQAQRNDCMQMTQNPDASGSLMTPDQAVQMMMTAPTSNSAAGCSSSK